MKRLFILLSMLLGLAACGAEPVWAPDDVVAKAHYASPDAPSLTLFTVVNVNSGNGGHSALMVSAPSERVLFDPAGSFHHPRLPERNDVVFGMTDPAVDFYIDYHSRESWRVVKQDLVVSPAVAEMALRLIKENGAVGHALCANSISSILRQLPGFEDIRVTFFPVPLQERFARRAGVVTHEYHDNDPDENGMIVAHGI
ncbi:MAG: hypothetical protein P8X50_00180 [Maritimibacter sp.]|jgi:hypothetical protein